MDEYKLLGVMLRSDLSWNSNTNYMVKRANKKLWALKRLKRLGANSKDLTDVYIKQIRSLLEFSVPVWHSSLTEQDKMKIERVQSNQMQHKKNVSSGLILMLFCLKWGLHLYLNFMQKRELH